jgi:hypothetical protein
MFKYSPLAKARVHNSDIQTAQTLYENTASSKVGQAIETVGDYSMKGISAMDNGVIYKLWNASQLQVQKDTGAKIGTEDNKKQAGVLLEKVIRETQSNSIMSERSGLARSENTLVKTFVMFMSDAQKQFSRLYESIGRMSALKWRLKNETLTDAQKAELNSELKEAKKIFRKTVIGFSASATIVALVTMLMRWLLKKDDKLNSLFAGTVKYKSEALKAYTDGNTELAETIMRTGVADKLGNVDKNVLNEITRLELNEYDATPKTAGSSITYDSVKYDLTGKQQAQFNKIHRQANGVVNKMLATKEYAALDDKGKAKAINTVYDYYYNLAVEDLLGVDIETKMQLLGAAVPIEKLAPIIAYCQSLESDTSKSGKTISGSRKTKIQKYLQSLSLTFSQKTKIMEYLGY